MKSIYLLLATILMAASTYGQTITGSGSVCLGGMETLSGSPAGGTWSSSDVMVAPIYGGGVYSGHGVGTATITYTAGAGSATTVVTVNSAVAPITGTATVCMGATTNLACVTPGGSWASANASVAIVSASGVVTGIYGPGTTTISYTLPSGCASLVVVTVNPTPAAITGPSVICDGTWTTLSCTTTGGTWMTSTPSVAVVGPTSGVVTGVAAGTTMITYTMSTGCFNTHPITVNPIPMIIGPSSYCIGSVGELYTYYPGGTWISGATPIATIGASSGTVNAVATGTSSITYTSPAGCIATYTVTVNTLSGPLAITGLNTVCQGGTVSLSCSTPGGTWTSDDVSVDTVSSTGIVTGLGAGNNRIHYTLGSGCESYMHFTVYPTPAITGPGTVCVGAMVTLSSTIVPGTWSVASGTGTATIGSATGVETGVTAGTAMVSYTVSGTGCHTTSTITVNTLAAAITGLSDVCEGTTATQSCITPGGTWYSSSPTIAAISSTTGVATGVTAGVTTISYVTGTGCASTKSLTVHPLPSAISGTLEICTGTTSTLSSAPVGGSIWTSSITSVATVSAAGIVTGVSAGTTTIDFTSMFGCTTSATLTVDPAPSITGTTGVCVGSTTALSSGTPGGMWTSASPTITVDMVTGVVSTSAAGTATITYTLPTGCPGTVVVTASATPAISITPLIPVSCSPLYKVVASGATTYSWAPSGTTPGVTSDTAYFYPDGTTYTVTGTTAGCAANSTFMATAPNRILGHISFSGPAPSGTSAKVWLVQYNSVDSSIIATDSMLTCLDGGDPYYEFAGKPVGDYLVKAKLLSSVTGTSDYIPTYGESSATWDVATPLIHATASDSLHIDMIYGTVPAGPGFISGYVYAGAGKGTSGEVPVANMIVYLRHAATGAVLTYTYTDATGAYSFGSLAYGNYVIYPEEMSYNTIPSAVITLSAGTPSVTGVGFKKRTTTGIIEPWTIPGAVQPVTATMVDIYPNPANDMIVVAGAKGMVVTITDVTGREVYTTTIANDLQPISVAAYSNGVYMVSATGNGNVQHFRLVKE